MKVGKKLSYDSPIAELEAAAPEGLKNGRDFIELSNTINSAPCCGHLISLKVLEFQSFLSFPCPSRSHSSLMVYLLGKD